MIKKTLILLFLLLASTSLVSAKRMPAPEVRISYDGIEYVAPNTPDKMGYIEAYDVGSGEKWEKKVYSVEIDARMEADVQWVFIKRMYVEENDVLVVVDEGDKVYKISLTDEREIEE